MSVHSRYISGNRVFYANANRKSLLDAIGPDVVKFHEDFTGIVAASDALVGWTTTLVEAGAGESTVTIPDGSAGTLLLTTDSNEDDGISLQKIGENFGFASTQSATYFGIRLKTSEATQTDLLVGLCITDTTLLGGMTDGVYFECLDGGATLSAVTEKDSSETQTDSVGTLVDATYITLEFFFDGSNVAFFVDGALVATHTATIPDDELLTPSIHFLTGAASAETCTVDWIRAIQVGR